MMRRATKGKRGFVDVKKLFVRSRKQTSDGRGQAGERGDFGETPPGYFWPTMRGCDVGDAVTDALRTRLYYACRARATEVGRPDQKESRDSKKDPSPCLKHEKVSAGGYQTFSFSCSILILATYSII